MTKKKRITTETMAKSTNSLTHCGANSIESVAEILRAARSNAYRAVNFTMVEAYWNVGRMIVEEEQQGKERAEYGKALIQEFGHPSDSGIRKRVLEANLRNFRQFYLVFQFATQCCESAAQNSTNQGCSQSPQTVRRICARGP